MKAPLTYTCPVSGVLRAVRRRPPTGELLVNGAARRPPLYVRAGDVVTLFGGGEMEITETSEDEVRVAFRDEYKEAQEDLGCRQRELDAIIEEALGW